MSEVPFKTLIDTTGREHLPTHRRRIQSDDNHRKDDFMRGGPNDPRGVGPELGESNTRHTKFTSGFFRRPAHLINPYAQRINEEEERAARAAARAPAREQYLQDQHQRHGNVVNTMMGRPQEEGLVLPTALAGDSSLAKLHERRRVNQYHLEGENRRRQLIDGNRFYAVNDGRAENRRKERMEANIMRQIGSSSVLGYGRKDLPSYGVWDNFRKNEEAKQSQSARQANNSERVDQSYDPGYDQDYAAQYEQTQQGYQQEYNQEPVYDGYERTMQQQQRGYNSRSGSRTARRMIDDSY